MPLPADPMPRRNHETERQELKQLRENFGLSQRKMGDYLGVSEKTYGQWERGERPCQWAALLVMRCWAEGHSAKSNGRDVPATSKGIRTRKR